jgi:hypothetical protein
MGSWSHPLACTSRWQQSLRAKKTEKSSVESRNQKRSVPPVSATTTVILPKDSSWVCLVSVVMTREMCEGSGLVPSKDF